MALGWPEHVPGWPMMPMGGAGQPMGNLDLRFPMFLGLRRSRITPVQRNGHPALSQFGTTFYLEVFSGFGPGGEPLKEGYSTLDTDTVH